MRRKEVRWRWEGEGRRKRTHGPVISWLHCVGRRGESVSVHLSTAAGNRSAYSPACTHPLPGLPDRLPLSLFTTRQPILICVEDRPTVSRAILTTTSPESSISYEVFIVRLECKTPLTFTDQQDSNKTEMDRPFTTMYCTSSSVNIKPSSRNISQRNLESAG